MRRWMRGGLHSSTSTWLELASGMKTGGGGDLPRLSFQGRIHNTLEVVKPSVRISKTPSRVSTTRAIPSLSILGPNHLSAAEDETRVKGYRGLVVEWLSLVSRDYGVTDRAWARLDGVCRPDWLISGPWMDPCRCFISYQISYSTE